MNARTFLPALCILGLTLTISGSYFCFLEVEAFAFENKLPSQAHSIRGRVLLASSTLNSPTTVSLSDLGQNPPKRLKRTLGYDGTFAFDGVTAGNYLVTIENQDFPTTARAVEIKESQTPKAIILTVHLAPDGSATIQEILKDANSNPSEGEEISRNISKKARKAFQRASEESARGNNTGSIEFLRKAIAEEPDYFEAYNNLGAQYQKLKRWDEAIEAFLKAIELRDTSIKPHLNLGNIYLSLEQPDSAIKHFQKAITLDPNSFRAYLGLGQTFFKKKDYASAGEYLETATRLDPRGAKLAFTLLIQAQILTRRFDRARYFLNAMSEFFPNDPDVSRVARLLNDLSDHPVTTNPP